jgi:hypothetical protein
MMVEMRKAEILIMHSLIN